MPLNLQQTKTGANLNKGILLVKLKRTNLILLSLIFSTKKALKTKFLKKWRSQWF